jgi:hypothetical protein
MIPRHKIVSQGRKEAIIADTAPECGMELLKQ